MKYSKPKPIDAESATPMLIKNNDNMMDITKNIELIKLKLVLKLHSLLNLIL